MQTLERLLSCPWETLEATFETCLGDNGIEMSDELIADFFKSCQDFRPFYPHVLSLQSFKRDCAGRNIADNIKRGMEQLSTCAVCKCKNFAGDWLYKGISVYGGD